MDGFAREGFADVWTPVAMAREVGKRPLGVTLASVRIALFRDASGRVSALHDQCPHRGVKLSLGTVGKDGCLECPFHGWRFAGDGSCTHIPLNALSEEKRRRFGATTFPVRERGGLIWLYTRPGAEAPDEPAVPEVLERPGVHVSLYAETWKAHWTRPMENMLDAPHLPFVHRRTIGRALRASITPESKMELEVHPTPTGFRTTWKMNDGRDSQGDLHWLRPNAMNLIIPIPKRLLSLFMWCIPVDEGHTRMLLVTARDFATFPPVSTVLDRFNRRVLHEDRATVESSAPSEVPPVSEEKSVGTDRATLAFRRWYLERKKQVERAPEDGPRELSPLAG